MASIFDRVRVFLKRWPIVRKQLNRLLEEENGKKIFKREGVGGISWDSTTDDLQQDQPGQFPYLRDLGRDKFIF